MKSKKLLILAAAVAVSSTAFAGDKWEPKPKDPPPATTPSNDCSICTWKGVYVNKPLNQIALLHDTMTFADATGENSFANNNLASNTYGVKIDANTNQIVVTDDAYIGAYASGKGSHAANNLASNVGSVYVKANLNQVAAVLGGAVVSRAGGTNSSAITNIATNNGCVTCSGAAPQ